LLLMVCAGLGLVGGGLVNPPPFVAEDDAGFFKTFFFFSTDIRRRNTKRSRWCGRCPSAFSFVLSLWSVTMGARDERCLATKLGVHHFTLVELVH
jgi:hypothetical protein